MFFKRTPEEGKWTHIVIFTRGRAGAHMRREREKGTGKEWERKRITAAVKNIRTFFKRTGIFLEKTMIF